MIRHTYNLQPFYNEDALTYYLLGAFCTDGNIRILEGNKGRVSIASKDYDWLVDINKHICPDKAIDKTRTCFVATYNSIELANWFIDHGCPPNKSLKLQTPNVPVKFVPDFIRGCWDGDGTLGLYRHFSKGHGYDITTRSCELFSASKSFAYGIQQMLDIIKLKSNVYIKTLRPRKIEDRMILSTNEQFRVSVSGKENISNFCRSIYYDDNRLSLKRKEAISKTLVADCVPRITNRQIVAIQNDTRTMAAIAKEYNISVRTLSRVKKIKTTAC